MRFLHLPLVLLAASASADFTDDFEAYTPGQDPEASGNWLRAEYGGHALVALQGGDQVLEAAFEDSLVVGYVCTAAGTWDDGSVGMSFSPDGDGAYCCVLARMVETGEAYAGGVVTVMQPFTAPPTDTLTLYRGAHPDYARGLSWTDTLATAEMFARRSPVPAQVYRATDVPASAILGALHSAGTFAEYIVDLPAHAEVATASAQSAA